MAVYKKPSNLNFGKNIIPSNKANANHSVRPLSGRREAPKPKEL
jgi:hypothetical protein